jgi:hypothetical protein
MKKIYLILAIILPVLASGQYVFNAGFQNVKFGGAGVTITPKVSNGTTAGSIVLYQNVVNIGGQQIDAIIRTVSVSAGAYMLFDQAGTGTGYTNNNPTWFSPQFLFPAGGGNAVFEFEFILGNSYNNTTNTGTTITLQNMMINSYDIDGNDSVGSNQFSEFGGFFTSEMATTSSIATTYNSTTNLTRFASTIHTNVVDASDPNTRVRVSYQEMSTFRISVGAGAAGVAYFFIDFDKGIDFTVPTRIITAPTMDLNTTTAGTDNSASMCSSGVVDFDAGTTNILSSSSTPSGGTALERLRVSFNTTDIQNGASEILKITSVTIPLNFANGAAIPSFSISGTTYAVTATVSGGESSLLFTKSGSATMTINEGERLLDKLQYNNLLSQPSVGNRVFRVRAKDGAYEGQAYTFTAAVGFTPTITQQPQASVITAGTNTSFTVTANAASYQWQVNPGTGTWSNISNSTIYSGATTNVLTLSNVPTTMNNYTYRAVTTNNTCIRNSANASLAVLLILPVKWLNVTGAVQNGGILIKWGTATEINTKSFIIQYSSDGKNFKNAGEVNATGNSVMNVYYSFLHTQPASGNNYYRIEQVDADGKSTFSKIVMVISGDVATVTVLGNPVANGQLSVQVNQTLNLMLFSADGKLIKHKQAVAGTHTIDVKGLSKGMYTLLAGTQAKRIIINN